MERDGHPAIEAAEAGDLERLAALLDAERRSVNARGWMGITPLIAATWHADSAPAVRFLLDRGADPHAVRANGDSALHWAASGAVAGLLVDASTDLEARCFGQTPLHVAILKGHVDVVRVLIAAGADITAPHHGSPHHGGRPLDLADDPRIARLLIEAGAPPSTGRPTTPLHVACLRAADGADDLAGDWAEVAELLLDHGADPALRDEFGALPSDLLGEDRRDLRDRLTAMVDGSVDLTLEDAAARPQEYVAVHPDRPEALTATFSGTVLVRWRLTPSITPVELIRVGGRSPIRGPYGTGGGRSLAFIDGGAVRLREWDDLSRSRPVPVLPEERYGYDEPVLSPDGRHLAVSVSSSEIVHLVDLDRGVITDAVDDLGDWSVVPRFAPDGRTLAVANSMQGTWWLTILDVDGGSLRRRRERVDGPPSGNFAEIISDVAFSPDGRGFATWVRPDHGRGGPNGYRGLVVLTWTHSGEFAWRQRVDNDIAGAPGDVTSASLCFTPDGSSLAVGLDDGVLWLDAATGEPVGRERTGAVAALAAHDTAGVVAATGQGLRRLDPTAATPVGRGTAGGVAGRLKRWISAAGRLPRSS